MDMNTTTIPPMIRYICGLQDKVLSVSENGEVIAKYDYHANGQLAGVVKNGKTEEFFWDGLALIKRGGTSYVNEPAMTGGNPILAVDDKSEKVLFNDMLGSTMGSVSGKDYKAVDMTLFGESKTEDEEVFFTGKPEVDGLGYAFAFRNYRSSLGKWQTADPLGYPDGWNNKAYVNNEVVGCIDRFGTDVYHLVDSEALAGIGHSAYIIGNSNDGYTMYNYGPSKPSVGEAVKNFSSLDEALKYARDKQSFDKAQMWETTAAQDAAAKDAANAYIEEAYKGFEHNCYQLGPDAIEGAVNNADPENKIEMEHVWGPNDGFDKNLSHKGVQNVTDKLQHAGQNPE